MRVVVYGAGGYGGVGLVENLLTHPEVEISALVSREGAGKPYSELYPHLSGEMDQVIEHAEEFDPKGRGDFVFLSTPDGVGQKIAPVFLDAGYKVIDFSGDFRFNDPDSYKRYSSRQQGETDHLCPELLEESVYAWPERYRSELKGTRLAGNPGCMAIACLLGVSPLFRDGLVKTDSLICDVKTGISGAGKKPTAAFHFPAADGNTFAYKVGKHQHVFEIERELGRLCGSEMTIDFVPHVVPMVRGILATCYMSLNRGVTFEDLKKSYDGLYAGEPFVQVEMTGRKIDITEVRACNRCRIGVVIVERTGRVVVTSHIDNLQKGQAGNAVQAMNIMSGFDESLGLRSSPNYP